MEIDHIFIFSKKKGVEADQLVKFGLSEGSSRVHPGQGTTNRKFYFENFFLEILWVHDEIEIRSKGTRVTNLRERSNFSSNEYSPFGLCLKNTPDTNNLFSNALTYEPKYFPEGMSIDFLSEPSLPWLFRLPLRGPKKAPNEPRDHAKKINNVIKAIFEVPYKNEWTTEVEKESEEKVQFIISNRKHLTIVFDHSTPEQKHEFPELSLTIKW